jgi:Nif-specific regulatory protein
MTPSIADSGDPIRVAQERDLYLRLLNLGLQDEPEPFLAEALQLVTQIVGAHQGYLEVGGCGDDGAPRWCASHGFSASELDDIRQATSRGIMAEALSTGETIVTRSAREDERFEARRSVRDARIEAVVCAPIGANPPMGVVYLQRRLQPGPFTEDDRIKVEMFARHVAPYVDRLVAKGISRRRDDPTEPYRERLRLDGFVGRSAAIAAVLHEVALVAPLQVDVLLTGASGTGKSQLARIIHDNGPRATQPFVDLNCAAIPESLIESELFGAVSGAHSTAVRRIEGKLHAAQRGTLLLDEVGELSPSAQAKLLQLLQSRLYYPLGSNHPVRADIRVIAATNADLEAAVAEGKFRQDLYYRLNVLPIRMPTLAERREDVGELARYFCRAACERHRLPRMSLSSQLVDALTAAEWPGNLRQLGHAIEVAAIRAAGSGLLVIERAHVFPGSLPLRPREPAAAGEASCSRLTFQEATRRFQSQLIRETLNETEWNIVETSRRLEIARSHLYALIRAFGIARSIR